MKATLSGKFGSATIDLPDNAKDNPAKLQAYIDNFETHAEDIKSGKTELPDFDTFGTRSFGSGGQAGGMGDLRMAESPAGPAPLPPQPYKDPNFSGGYGQPNTKAAMIVPRFVGDAAKSASTGIVNAAFQGVQDNWGHPIDAVGGVIKQELKNIASPLHTFEKPVQSSSESFQRAGLPNNPMKPPMRYPGEQWPGGDAPIIGLADQAGLVADMFTPAIGLGLVKPIARGISAGVRGIADPIGAGLENFAVGQSKSITPFLSRHIRDGAKNETFFKEDLMGPKNQIFEKARTLRKELGQQQGEIIKQGKDAGVRIDGREEIKKMMAPHLEDPGSSLQSSRLTDPASQKFLKKAETFITRLSPKKDGILDLRQAQTVKQWLQKQAEYTGPADAAGIPLVAAPGEAALTAGDLGHQFKSTIESVAPEGLADINKRMNDLYPIERAAGWRQMIRDRAPPVNLKDYVGLGQLITSPIWAASKLYGSGRVANIIYKLGAKLRAAKTPEEAAKYVETLQKAGMDAEDINSAVAVSKSPDGLPKNEDEFSNLFQNLKFGDKAPEAPAQFDPLEAMNPRNRTQTPQVGQGSIEDLAPPEMAQARQQAGQDAREAYVRQDRPARISQPTAPAQQPTFRTVTPTEAALKPRQPVGDIPSNFPQPYIENPKVAQVLDEVQGRRGLTGETDKIKALKVELKNATTKEAKQKILAKMRDENYRTPLGNQ